MNHPCAISVVIPCFNHGEFLPEAVGSILAANRNDIEMIVVDDGSTEASTRLAVDKVAAQGISVIRQANQGLAAARNAAISKSKGRYIFPLDADDRLRPDWLDRGIAILDSQLEVGVVYGDAQRFGARTDLWNVGPFKIDSLLEMNFIHASALYRRSVWEQNGGYDGTMPVQGEEDWDFWLSAVEHGWQFAYLPEVFFDYRISEVSMITRANIAKKRTDEFVARKHALLYRRRSIELAHEKVSVRATSRNLLKLVKRNLRHP